jgi:hypothetical protein
MGQATLHADGVTAQPGEAGGSGVRRKLLPGLRPVRLSYGSAVRQMDRR